MAQNGELGAELLKYFSTVASTVRATEDHYAGCFESVADFASEITEQTQDVPDHFANYIDYGAMGRDMRCGDIFTIETAFNETHVFWEH